MTVQPGDDQLSELEHRAGVQCDLQTCAARFGVDVGAGIGDATVRMVHRGELSKGHQLRGVPARLGELHAGAQRPERLDAHPLPPRGLVGGDRAGECDVHLRHQRRLARIGVDHDAPGRRVGRGNGLDPHRGRKKSQRGQDFFGIGTGRRQQAQELAVVQIGQFGKTPQFEPPRDHVAHIGRRAHVDLESGLPGLGLGLALRPPLGPAGRPGRVWVLRRRLRLRRLPGLLHRRRLFLGLGRQYQADSHQQQRDGQPPGSQHAAASVHRAGRGGAFSPGAPPRPGGSGAAASRCRRP